MMNWIKAFFILLPFFVASCTPDTVYRSNQQAVQVGLYSIYTKNDTTPSQVYAYGLGKTTAIYDSASIKELFLPLRYDADSTIFTLRISQKVDTIIFYHSKEQIYLSDKDGFSFNMHLHKLSYSTNIIDSVAFSNPAIIYNETLENVKLYIY